jgi:AcrR family transcriptional regulator
MAAAARPSASSEETARASPERTARARSLLRAAERVFAIDGYDGATMRQLAQAAGVGVSLLVYHFETKQNLYYQVFLDRQHINEARRKALHDIADLTAPNALEQIVAAFADPVLALHDDPDDIWFARLVLREAADPSSQSRPAIKNLFDPMAREFIAALRRALPDKPPGFHEWGYLFSVGALTQSSFDDRVDGLTTIPFPRDRKHAFLREYITAALRYG